MTAPATAHALAALRRFVQARSLERCELCGRALTPAHDHLLQLSERRLVCACTACALLFPGGASAYRRLQTRVTPLPSLRLDEGDWCALDVPVRLVFVSPSRAHARVFASYPNRAGVVQSTLPQRAWDALLQAHPELAQIEPDVEGLWIDGLREPSECYHLSIDVCHRLIGTIRARSHSSWNTAQLLGELGASHA